jgi:hypothetical protein
MPIKIIRPNYTLKDPLNVRRWMCGKCGLVFDNEFDSDGPGAPEFDPPLNADYGEFDDEGNYHSEEPERRVLCPRCKADFDETPFIPIQIAIFDFGDFKKTTLVVEDKAHEKAIQEVANCLGKDVFILQAGTSQNVKSFFALAKVQGKLANAYFLVDGDNQGVDKELANETHFIHLEQYCIENYFLDFDVCAAVAKKSIRGVKNIALQAIKKSSKSLGKGPLSEFLVNRLTISDLTKDVLAHLDASKFIEGFVGGIGFSKPDEFKQTYVKYCHQHSRLAHVFPARLVKAIRSAKQRKP